MNALCLVLLLCASSFLSLAYERDFYGEVTADELVYVAIEVPRYAQYFEVQIWAEASDLNPTVLLRYDGLPTTKLFDAKLSIPSPPSALQLIDVDPTQSMLYLGLFGGSTLHRFRYFAGEASKILVGVETNVTSCPNEFQRGPNCALAEVLATGASGRLTEFSLAANTTRSHLVVVPSHSERLQLAITTADVGDMCEQLRATDTTEVAVQFDLYLDQPAEENNAAHQVHALNYSSLCAGSVSSGSVLGTLTVNRPLPGVWTFESKLRLAGAPNDSAKATADSLSPPHEVARQVQCGKKQLQVRLLQRGLLASSRSSAFHKAESTPSVSIALPLEITASLTTCTTGHTTSATYSSSSPAGEVTSNNATCTASVAPLNSVRTPLVAQGVYSMHASPVKLPAANTTLSRAAATRNPFVVFEAQLPSQVQLMAVGGGLVVQITVGLSDSDGASNAPKTSSEFISMMDDLHFLVAVRFGGLPADPDVYDYSKAGSDARARSPNAFLLSSRVAVTRDSPVASASTDDDDSDVADSTLHLNAHTVPHRYAHWATAGQAPPRPSIRQRTHRSGGSGTRTFTWVITRPALPNLFASSLGGGDVPMFLRVSRELPSVSGSESHAAHPGHAFGVMHGPPARDVPSLLEETLSEHAAMAGGFDLGVVLEVSASVVFEPCPERSCVHGQCFTQYGDVPAYTCACTYPWAGESCDTLSVPYGFYVVQVLILTLSNLAMIPAVFLSMAGHLPFVGTVLGLSAAASGVYHLCDVDVYCLGGLSFHSLQVMDILFSISAISCILLMYAPVTRSCHAALSLLCVGLLVPPVADLPTSPVNLALSLTFALAVLALGWGLVLNSSVKRGRSVHIVGGMFVNSTTDPFLCEGNSTLNGRQSAQLSTTAGRSAQVRNSIHYASIASTSPDVSVHGMSGHDLEMVALGGAASTGDTDSEAVDPADPAGVLGADPPCLTLCAPGVQRVWVLPTVGLVIGLAGLMCFALQARESYYILHSLWHVFMMIAAYFMVKGRIELYRAV